MNSQNGVEVVQQTPLYGFNHCYFFAYWHRVSSSHYVLVLTHDWPHVDGRNAVEAYYDLSGTRGTPFNCQLVDAICQAVKAAKASDGKHGYHCFERESSVWSDGIRQLFNEYIVLDIRADDHEDMGLDDLVEPALRQLLTINGAKLPLEYGEDDDDYHTWPELSARFCEDHNLDRTSHLRLVPA